MLVGLDCYAAAVPQTVQILNFKKIRQKFKIKISKICSTVFAPTYPVWAYYAHGRQRRCQEDPVRPPPVDRRRQPGRPRIPWLSTVQQDLKQHHLTLPEAADLAQNRPLWRMMSTYGATQS